MSTTSTSFEITRFKNASGTFSWRVSGSLHGVRIRKNVKTRELAAAEKALLEIRSAQATSGFRAAMTLLTEPQLREAEDAFRRMEGRSQTLLTYLEFAFSNFRDPRKQKQLVDAVTPYMQSVRPTGWPQ